MFSFLKQSTASQTRIVGPFVDDTDFKTLETGLTINNTDVKLSKNGGAAANKNSGGGTHIANGNYALTFDATDTSTVGELHVSISVSGALVVVAKFWVLEEAIYDALLGASAAGFDTSGNVTLKSGTHTGATIPTVTTLTGHTVQTGDTYSLLTSAQSEPGQAAPAVNETPLTKLAYLFKAWRNKKTNDGSTTKLYDDAGTTVDQKQTTSEAAGTVTKAEWVTGP